MKITAPAGFFDFSRAIIRVNAHTTTGSRFNHLLVTMTDASGFFSLARFFSASFPFSGFGALRRKTDRRSGFVTVARVIGRVDAGNPLAPKPTAVPRLIRIKVATRLRRSHTARRSIP
jgi:hypothetical protein